jgi:hypothetical protein
MGDNCGLQVPPKEAGEDGFEGGILLIYPRRAQIGKSYTGCQLVWLGRDGKLSPYLVGVFRSGKLERMINLRDANDPIAQCLFKDGKLVQGDSKICQAVDLFPFRSMPPGCLSELTAKSRGVNKDCETD